MNAYSEAAIRLHTFLRERFWDGAGLVGPDNGVRFNRRLWRFFKSAAPMLPWHDDYYYLQGQGYWVLDNWRLHDLTGEDAPVEIALACSREMTNRQHPEGHWDYPHPEWGGRVGTVEGIFAALGLLESYARTRDEHWLDGVLRWYSYLVHETGFQPAREGLAINYFSNWTRGLIPNNSTLALAFFGRLAQVTGDDQYLQYCPEMIAFLADVQLETGEFPYSLEGLNGEGKDKIHFQCFQYHAFQLQDLAMYHEATGDGRVLPLIRKVAEFIEPSVRVDGSTQFDCADSGVQMPYNTAAIAAALNIARRLGVHDARAAEDRAYGYVLREQRPGGGYWFSRGDYGFLRDNRYYPRPMTMLLYHLLLKAQEGLQVESPIFSKD